MEKYEKPAAIGGIALLAGAFLKLFVLPSFGAGGDAGTSLVNGKSKISFPRAIPSEEAGISLVNGKTSFPRAIPSEARTFFAIHKEGEGLQLFSLGRVEQPSILQLNNLLNAALNGNLQKTTFEALLVADPAINEPRVIMALPQTVGSFQGVLSISRRANPLLTGVIIFDPVEQTIRTEGKLIL